MSRTTTFRLINGKKEGTYSLKRGMAKKNGVLKHISYRPGTNSIFDEDNKDSAILPKEVVFRYNDILTDPAIEIIVPNGNQVLLDFLMAHPKHGIDYKVYDEEVIAKEKIGSYDDIEKALGYLNDQDDEDIKGTALAVFGQSYFQKSATKCKAALKEKAIKSPKEIIKVCASPDFHNRHLVSLLYCAGTISNNNSNTAVVWSDTGNTIIPIAKGESGIDKLTEYLSTPSAETTMMVQEFSARIAKSKKAPADATKAIAAKDEVISEKDAEIERLKAQLAAAQASKEPEAPKVDLTDEEKLKKARAEYKDLTGNNVPIRFVNNIEWIEKELLKGQTAE